MVKKCANIAYPKLMFENSDRTSRSDQWSALILVRITLQTRTILKIDLEFENHEST